MENRRLTIKQRKINTDKRIMASIELAKRYLDFAIINNRNDGLVRRWKEKITQRDKICQDCESDENLHIHHIIHWADDPINRTNEANGILLCKKCHAEYHHELEKFIMSRGDKL